MKASCVRAGFWIILTASLLVSSTEADPGPFVTTALLFTLEDLCKAWNGQFSEIGHEITWDSGNQNLHRQVSIQPVATPQNKAALPSPDEFIGKIATNMEGNALNKNWILSCLKRELCGMLLNSNANPRKIIGEYNAAVGYRDAALIHVSCEKVRTEIKPFLALHCRSLFGLNPTEDFPANAGIDDNFDETIQKFSTDGSLTFMCCHIQPLYPDISNVKFLIGCFVDKLEITPSTLKILPSLSSLKNAIDAHKIRKSKESFEEVKKVWLKTLVDPTLGVVGTNPCSDTSYNTHRWAHAAIILAVFAGIAIGASGGYWMIKYTKILTIGKVCA